MRKKYLRAPLEIVFGEPRRNEFDGLRTSRDASSRLHIWDGHRPLLASMKSAIVEVISINYTERTTLMSKISAIGLDLAKNVFQIHAVDGNGQAVMRK